MIGRDYTSSIGRTYARAVWADGRISAFPEAKEFVVPGEAGMASEDFSRYALEDPKPPICMFPIGAVDTVKFKEARGKGLRLPGPRSSEFAPVPERTIRTGVKAMNAVVLDLLKK